MASVTAPGPIAPPVPRLRAEGAFELALAFRAINKEMGDGIKEALENAAEPVRSGATTLAREQISGVARGRIPWYQMRIGSNLSKGLVYIAPQQRSTKLASRKRPNLAPRLLAPMLQSLESNAGRVEDEFERTVDDATRAWERI
jgi:hypothetical protein